MKNLICIVGRTNCGKDTLAGRILKELNINAVVSYTTREKRVYETDGKQHYFISDKDMDWLVKNQTLIAYTKNEKTGDRYCAVFEDLFEDEYVYIINPDGIKWLKEHGPKECNLFIVELWVEDEILRKRAQMRGDVMETFEKRLRSESEEFAEFHNSGIANISIDGTLTPDEVYEHFLQAYNYYQKNRKE